MPNVDITINNRMYKITCDDGQEERLHTLAAWADERLKMIADEVGQIGDTRLMLLTLLMVSDEYFEATKRNKQLEEAGYGEIVDADNKASSVIDAATARINELNEKLDRTNA